MTSDMALNTCANSGCGNTLTVRTSTRGRRTLYCSVSCRRAAEYAVRRKTKEFEGIKAKFAAKGEDAVRRLAEDPECADQLRELAETYLKPPDGRELVSLDDPEVVELLFTPERRFNVISHDNPLPSSSDIDLAEQTGDWGPMVEAALKSMSWQLANDYKPDLREWEVSGF
jgi:hypothetical protein